MTRPNYHRHKPFELGRFADIDKVEKNFTKHCNDITGRDCSAKEKANFVTYLISVK